MRCFVLPGLLRLHTSPKVGSTSIRHAVRDAGCFKQRPREDAGPEYRWGVVRHPLDRLVSCWSFFQSGRGRPHRAVYRPGMTFEDFVLGATENPARDKHTRPQTFHLGPHEFDRLALFEHLAHEWERLRGRFTVLGPLPHVNHVQRDHWTTFYSPDLRARAEAAYADDLALYNRNAESLGEGSRT